MGTDLRSVLQVKKRSRFFSNTANSGLSFGLFLSQFLGWFLVKLLSGISYVLGRIVAFEKALIAVRIDTLQLFYWGRGNVFALFFQAVLFFIVIAVVFSTLVGQGIQNRILEQYDSADTQVVLYASAADTVIEAGSLTTNMPQERKRLDIIEYVVTYDDTLGSGSVLENIAADFEVSVDSIRWTNNFAANHKLKPGDRIKIPPISGSIYTIQAGETIDSLSKRFNIDKGTLVETNYILPPYEVKAGQTIFLINTAPVIPTVRTATRPNSRAQLIYGTGGGTFTPPPGVGRFLLWPVPSSSNVSRCWLRYHDGIDIYPSRGGNPPIVAAADGRVTSAGYKCDGPACGFAWRVEIDHGNGFSTLYGHLNGGSGKGIAAGLGIGDVVKQGQLIGYMGSTGWSTGTHLHFRLAYNGRAVNPAPFLSDPKSCR